MVWQRIARNQFLIQCWQRVQLWHKCSMLGFGFLDHLLYISLRSSVCMSVCLCVRGLLQDQWADLLHIWWKDASHTRITYKLYFMTEGQGHHECQGHRSLIHKTQFCASLNCRYCQAEQILYMNIHSKMNITYHKWVFCTLWGRKCYFWFCPHKFSGHWKGWAFSDKR